MKRAYLLVATVVLLAGCGGRQQDTIAFGSGDTAAGSVNAQDRARALSAVPSWATYREFNFDSTTVDISISDTPKLREIVDRLARDSTLDIAIVGALDGEKISPADRNLNHRRAASVRQALMDTGAGVASYKILMGPFSDPHSARAGQILVWVGPRSGSPSPSL